MLKVVILVPLFPPRRLGGTEISAYNIAKHLAIRGHEVHVITSLDEGLPKQSREIGFSIYRVSFPKIPLVGILLYWLKILFTIRKINPDIVHVQGITLTATVGLINNILFRKTYIIYARGSDIYFSWKYKSIIIKHIFNRSTAVIALTSNLKEKIREINKKDVFVVPNGVDLDKFDKLVDRYSLRSKMGISAKDKVLLFVGTLKPVKGVKYLIRAMSIIKDFDENVKLLIVGDGEEKEYLIHLTKRLHLDDSISFIGKVPNEKVPHYMHVSDLLVQPSISEGFPVVILEAMAAGLPIVTTNVTGLPEIVCNLKNGLLVEPKNSEDIADKVLLIIHNKGLQKTFSNNNKKKVRQYSWQEVVKKIEKLYLYCLK